MCHKTFYCKRTLNRHVKRIYQDHYTKPAYGNSTCTEESCTRGVRRGIQSVVGCGPFFKGILNKENKDEDSDTSNGSDADSDTPIGSDTNSDTSNGFEADGWNTPLDV